MRNWKWMAKAFVSVATVGLLAAGCEEVDRQQEKVAQVAMAPSPSTAETPRASAPPPVATTPVAPPPGVAPGAKPSVAAARAVEGEEPGDDPPDVGKKPTELVAAARKALAEHKLDRAEQLAHVATLKAPGRWQAWNTLGRVQLQAGRRKQAIASFEKAVELEPQSSYAQNNLGLAYLYDGRWEDAADALEEATELEPVESYMWNNLGMAYEHLDRLEEARQAYRNATDLENGRAGENLARLVGVKSVRTAKAEVKPESGDDVDLPAVTDVQE